MQVFRGNGFLGQVSSIHCLLRKWHTSDDARNKACIQWCSADCVQVLDHTTAPADTCRGVRFLDRDLVCCWLYAGLACRVQLAVAGVDGVTLLAHPLPLVH